MSRSEKNSWWMARWHEHNPADHWTGEIGGKYRHARRWIQRQGNKAERRKARDEIRFHIAAEDPMRDITEEIDSWPFGDTLTGTI